MPTPPASPGVAASSPLSPGAAYEAERAARIANNRERMRAALAATGALRAAGPPVKKPAPAPKKPRPAAKRDGSGDGDHGPPLRRSTRARRAAGAADENCVPSLQGDGDEGGDGGDADGPSTSLTREQRLARLEGGGGGGATATNAQRRLTAAPRLAWRGGSLNKDLLADEAEVRALSLWRLQTMSLKAVANRVKALTNATKLKDFAEVLRERAAELAAEDADAAVEYDSLADEAEAKWGRLTAG